MAIVGDYGIISDNTFIIGPTGGGSQQFDFDLPDQPHDGSRSILMFNIRLIDPDDFDFEVRLNNESVYTAVFHEERYMTIHEVLPAGLLKKNANHMLLWHTGDGKARIGDIVVLYQHQI